MQNANMFIHDSPFSREVIFIKDVYTGLEKHRIYILSVT